MCNQSKEIRFTITVDLCQYLQQHQVGLACTFQIAGHGVTNSPQVCYILVFFNLRVHWCIQPCQKHQTLDRQPFLQIRSIRTSFYVGEMVPLFYYGTETSTNLSSRQCAVHLLFSCATTCGLSLLPPCTQTGANLHFLIVNCFMIRKKMEIIRPLPDYTRNFLFRVTETAITSRIEGPGPSGDASRVPASVSAPQLPRPLSTLSRASILGRLNAPQATPASQDAAMPETGTTSRRASKRKQRPPV